jgi:hypothetical protein
MNSIQTLVSRKQASLSGKFLGVALLGHVAAAFHCILGSGMCFKNIFLKSIACYFVFFPSCFVSHSRVFYCDGVPV